ncbi:cytochrome c oxidase cbb3-type subunit 3 [Cyclonatronum proteinivorum]|uniref:Cytochrome c oxidase cbb3-type subunit 3 n=1 Tax=Cyclonatronum proteinivorum TaxID=1457365 RepID=A0A345UNX9_9BACT|nr:cbb3-type cytochrome c oxidase N-terminal domain-containing protein [Cyclonatronum proteinivorum]AXJ02181.1 cytochrome c oxidase cbb3-type subunit 3 [Cyclonatronum proteinivorum]
MAEQSKKPKNDPDKNLILDDERDLLMDHEYDGIQELDNNMPPWWLYGFYVTIIFAVGYLLYYDVLGWGPSQEEEYEIEMAMAAERYGIQETEARDFSQAVLLTDAASLERGREVFNASTNLCTTCHGQNAQGLVGPDLTNEYWKYGCDMESLMVSISEGFPTRGMPAYGSTVRIGDDDLAKLASYIISLRGTNPAGAKAPDMSRSERCEDPTAAGEDVPAADE